MTGSRTQHLTIAPYCSGRGHFRRSKLMRLFKKILHQDTIKIKICLRLRVYTE